MEAANGGVMTAEELFEGEHNISGLAITTVADPGFDALFVVHCPCGWKSRPLAKTRDAVAEWQLHRDRV